MNTETIKKFLSTTELIDIAKKHKGIDALLTALPDNMGINLCAVKGMEFEVQNDKYGQLLSLNIIFIPSEDKELLEQGQKEYGVKPWYDLWRCQEMKKED
ncbi:MAG: hypothetical protein MJZ64_00395 [Paludibacteraceae bacterium]|nr:hypothetical protein [Paludibacteraceae bacterium]